MVNLRRMFFFRKSARTFSRPIGAAADLEHAGSIVELLVSRTAHRVVQRGVKDHHAKGTPKSFLEKVPKKIQNSLSSTLICFLALHNLVSSTA